MFENNAHRKIFTPEKTEVIVDWKIHNEESRSYIYVI
jgi:hypothetical protein